jgi:DNA polymerase-3 subunit alpha
MVDSFVNRKHGREKITYLHPLLEPILKNTYGVILYQEQAMRIANVIGGFTLEDADSLRKAMAKKKADMMEKYRRMFIENAPGRGVSAEIAEELFEQIETFAGYGFNKSHSAAYAVITYQTAWLKAHYPLEFMAAVLSSILNETEKLVDRMNECKHAGFSILPPDVNKSGAMFRREGRNAIRFALAGIKGVGVKAAENIAAEARKEPFSDFFSFCERVDLRLVNKGTIESLIFAGALDCLPGFRSQKASVLEEAIAAAQRSIAERDSGQMNLFGALFPVPPVSNLPSIKELPEEELLAREHTALGFFLSGHPVERYSELADAYTRYRIRDVIGSANDGAAEAFGIEGASEEVDEPAREVRDEDGLILVARIAAVSRRSTKDGKRMAILQLQDQTGSIDAVLYPEGWTRFATMLNDLQGDACYFVVGHADFSRETPQIIVEDLVKPSEVLEKLTGDVSVTVIRETSSETIDAIKWLHDQVKVIGRGKVHLLLRVKTGDWLVNFNISPEFNINFGSEVLKRLRSYFGDDNVKVFPIKVARPQRRKNGSRDFRNGSDN